MNRDALTDRIAAWLETLCVDIGQRPVGSAANRKATDFVARTLQSIGLQPQTMPFNCLDWQHGDVLLQVAGRVFQAHVSPYSRSCDVRAELVAASTIEEVERNDMIGKLLLLHGPVANEPLMPKNFPFYNPEHHRRIVSALETSRPAAIIASTGRNPESAGALYPFPLIEDGDFDIPSAYMKDVDGEQLWTYVGSEATLRFVSERLPATGCNVLAPVAGAGDDRIVVCAHIDTKPGTPGALDNATGVVVLLALAELLADSPSGLTTEVVALNGEDHYSAPGQLAYLAADRESADNIVLAINLDGAGCRWVKTALSFYGAGESIEATFRDLIRANDRFIVGEPWYQGDHSIFVQAGRPAVAVTSENIGWQVQEITHTESDTIEHVAPAVLADIAVLLRECVVRLGGLAR